MDVSIQVAAAERIGQDRAEVIACGCGYLLVLADGAGGTADGGAAADYIIAHARSSALSTAADCVALLKYLDGQLRATGETTAVLAFVVNGEIQGASVGDSAAWLITPTGIVDLTRHQQRKPLIGSGNATPIGFGPISCSHHRVVLGTDGLFKYVPHVRIRQVAATIPLSEAAAALVRAARLPSGALQDDIAVIVAGL